MLKAFADFLMTVLLKAVDKSLNHSTEGPLLKVRALLVVSKPFVLAYYNVGLILKF